jgi:hypothetical protein
VSWRSQSGHGAEDWQEFHLRVTSLVISEGRFRMDGELHTPRAEQLSALRRAVRVAASDKGAILGRRYSAPADLERLPASNAPALARLLAPPPGLCELFRFDGPLSEEIAREQAELLHSQCLAADLDTSLQRALVSVATELLRNVSIHGVAPAELDERLPTSERPIGSLMVGTLPVSKVATAVRPPRAWVACANHILTADAPSLLETLRSLRTLGPAAVRIRLAVTLRRSHGHVSVARKIEPHFGLLTLARESRAAIEATAVTEPNPRSRFARLVIRLQV